MTLNFHTEYALRILIYLLLHPDEVTPTRVIAEKYGISTNHLNKVSQKLVTLGVVSSTRGKGGGITLNESSKSIKIGDLMRSIEPTTEAAQCSGGGGLGPCVISPVCMLRGILGEAQLAFWQHLNQYEVKDLLGENAKQMRTIFENA